MLDSKISLGGKVSTKVTRNPLNQTGNAWELFKATLPTNSYKLKNYSNIVKPLAKIGIANLLNIPTFYGVLTAKKVAADGVVTDYGIISLKSVTSAGVMEVTDEMAASVAGSSDLSDFAHHGIGTGTDAEAVGDTTLGTEVETRVQDTADRASSASGNNAQYETIATHSATAARAVTEHGLFTASTGGVLFDRSVFSVINLASGDSLTTTYQATFNSGG